MVQQPANSGQTTVLHFGPANMNFYSVYNGIPATGAPGQGLPNFLGPLLGGLGESVGLDLITYCNI